MVPVVLLVLPGRDVMTVTLPVVLVAAVVARLRLPPRLGVVAIVARPWVGHGWSVVGDQVVRSVSMPTEVVIDDPAVGMVVVVVPTAITPVGASVTPVGERPGHFEVVARAIGAHLGEPDSEMGTSNIEGASERPTGQLRRSRNSQKGEQDSHEKKHPERDSKLHVGHLLTAR
jgi:hypothetical protein